MAAVSGGHRGNFYKINDASSTTTANPNPTQKLRQTLTSPSSADHHQQQPHIPIDLIAKILSKLPLKLLIRLKCICKSWNALISDPHFAKQQFRASTSDPTRLTRHHLVILTLKFPSCESIIRDYSLSSVLRSSAARPSRRRPPGGDRCFSMVAGSCHGMLCLASDPMFPVLLNPCTGKFKDLPPLKPRPQENFSIYGLGFDDFSDCYKMVSVVTYRRDVGDSYILETDVKVHTLGTDSWRQIQGFPSCYPVDGSGKFVSGALNFLSEDDGVTHCSWFIVSLNLRTETYRRLLLPDCLDDTELTLTSGVLRGCLCILLHDYTDLDVWLMKEYGNKESWTKVFRVPYMSDFLEYHRYHRAHSYYASALCISEDGEEILLENEFKLVVYNSKRRAFRTHGVQKLNCPMIAEVYEESLISPF